MNYEIYFNEMIIHTRVPHTVWETLNNSKQPHTRLTLGGSDPWHTREKIGGSDP